MSASDVGVSDDCTPPKCKPLTSRYIQSLKRHAERRKLENERRMERQVQKERLAEGEEFKDKETFVTSSYKKKLQEFQKMEEEEKRMDRLEEIGDVSKQKDISGFYRHLYKTTVDIEQKEDKKDQGAGNEKESNNELKTTKSPPREASIDPVKPDGDDQIKQKRQYRKRTKSSSSKEEGEKTSSSSSSSSSSYSSSSSSDSGDDKRKKRGNKKQIRERSPDKKRISLSHGKASMDDLTKSTIDDDGKENKYKKPENIKDADKHKHEVPKIEASDTKTILKDPVSVNIWVKRTIGIRFDETLQRYLERKSKRQGSC